MTLCDAPIGAPGADCEVCGRETWLRLPWQDGSVALCSDDCERAWPRVLALREQVKALESRLSTTELAVSSWAADLVDLARSCGQRDDEYPKQAVARLLAEQQRQLDAIASAAGLVGGSPAAVVAEVARLRARVGEVEGVTSEPRELHCEDCDRDYPPWVAPSPLWNEVVRQPSDAAGVTEPFLCLTCFALRAEDRGVRPTAWVVRPERAEDLAPPLPPACSKCKGVGHVRGVLGAQVTCSLCKGTSPLPSSAAPGDEGGKERGR